MFLRRRRVSQSCIGVFIPDVQTEVIGRFSTEIVGNIVGSCVVLWVLTSRGMLQQIRVFRPAELDVNLVQHTISAH